MAKTTALLLICSNGTVCLTYILVMSYLSVLVSTAISSTSTAITVTSGSSIKSTVSTQTSTTPSLSTITDPTTTTTEPLTSSTMPPASLSPTDTPTSSSDRTQLNTTSSSSSTSTPTTPPQSTSLIDCGPTPDFLNATPLNNNGSKYGAVASYECEAGFREFNITCLINGTWEIPKSCYDFSIWKTSTTDLATSATTPPGSTKTNPVDCGLAPTIANATDPLTYSTVIGSKLNYTCDSGYTRYSEWLSIACLADGSWEEPNSNCSVVECGEPLSLPPGTHFSLGTSTGIAYGDTATYTCDTGYNSSTTMTVSCLSNGSWETPAINCSPVVCAVIADNAIQRFMSTSSQPSVYLDTGVLQCQTGYRLQGLTNTDVSITIGCTQTGAWNQSTIACEKKDCGSPPSGTNSSLTTYSEVKYDNVTYTCDTGYNSSTTIIIYCLSKGIWETPAPNCSLVDCGPATTFANAALKLTTNSTKYGGKAEYTCNIGYTRYISDFTVNCQADGNWEVPNDNCSIVDCGPAPTFANADFNRTTHSTKNGDKAEYTCNIGYTRYISDFTVNCQADGNWEVPNDNCSIIDCGLVPPIAHATPTVILTTYGSFADYECDPGYSQFANIFMTTCQANGTWKVPDQNCSIADCGPATTFANAALKLTTNSTKYGDKAEYTCDIGYTRYISDFTINCEADGNWEVPNDNCSTILLTGTAFPVAVCRDPPKNGQHSKPTSINSTTHGDTANYTCDPGYEQETLSLTISCLSDGTWDTSTPNCSIKDCGNAPKTGLYSILNSTDGSMFGSTATYVCDTGYSSAVFPLTISCQSSGTWETLPTACKLIDCGAPQFIGLNSTLEFVQNTTYESVALYKCDTGYNNRWGTNRNITVMCLADGTWSDIPDACQSINCGYSIVPQNGIITYYGDTTYGNTTFGNTAIFTCDTGYTLAGNANRQCLATGNWSGTTPECNETVCETVKVPDNGNVNMSNTELVFSTVIDYSCKAGYILQGISKRTCLQTGNWSGNEPSCAKEPAIVLLCATDTTRGNTWQHVYANQIATMPCEVGFDGDISRECDAQGIWKLPINNCIRKALHDLEHKIDALISTDSESTSSPTATASAVSSALTELTSLTTLPPTNDNGNTIAEKQDHGLHGGEIKKVTSVLRKIASISSNINVTQTQSQAFFNTTGNLLDSKNKESWKSIDDNTDTKEDSGAAKVMMVVDTYATAIAKSLGNSNETKRVILQENMVVMVAKVVDNKTIVFPNEDIKHKQSSSFFYLPKNLSIGITTYSGIFYKNLTGIMSTRSVSNKDNQEINSAVLSMTLGNKTSTTKLTSKVLITLQHFHENDMNMTCSFWNTSKCREFNQGWESRDTGGYIVGKNGGLKSRLGHCFQNNVESTAIDIISIVGCSVSMLGLIITVVMHMALWRYVRSDRVVILVNLAIALVIAYAIFLGGVDKTENKDVCTVIAVLLQYIYLVVFFLMLAEGIEIGVTVLYVFTSKSRLKWILPSAWGIPAIIVGISMGATQLEGFGSNKACWLSVDGGLIWAFVAPAVIIILVNVVLLILVIKAMFGARTLAQKSRTEKTKAGVRCLALLLPLMGCTWMIGVFYVNEKSAWIQYTFAVCNSLQGFVIFIFHCALNRQIRVAIQRRQKKYRDSTSFTKSTSKPFSLPRVSSASTSSTVFARMNSVSSLQDSEYDDDFNVTDTSIDKQYNEMNNRSRKNWRSNESYF